MDKQITTIETGESKATRPARLLALQGVANLSDRQLAYFHWREANEILSALEHKIRDYDDELSSFAAGEDRPFIKDFAKISEHLSHVQAIVVESAASSEKGGAS